MDGRVTLTRLVALNAYCDLSKNIKDYPFDSHECPIRFGSFTYNKNQLKLSIKNIEIYRKMPPIKRKNVDNWAASRRDFISIDFNGSRGMS